jgi:zinc D-Ala-D-Ala dipeptidase
MALADRSSGKLKLPTAFLAQRFCLTFAKVSRQGRSILKWSILLQFCISGVVGKAQSAGTKAYGLETVSDIATYRQLVKVDSMQQLVDLKQFIPTLYLDIRYAGRNNFLGEPVYRTAKAYMNIAAAKALMNVQKYLNERGLGLKIFDAYRPYQVTVLFYEKVRDTVFVASPYRGSRHNRGAAVDLTLIELASGKELDMPTPFDDFSKKAHTNYSELPPTVINNRELLKTVMVKNGFEIYADEWWHYDYKGWRAHPILDLSFEDLELLN